MQAGFGCEALLQVSQAAMPHLGEWCHSGYLVLVSGTGRLGTQQQLRPGWLWREVYVVELIYNLNINCGLAFPFFEKKKKKLLEFL